MVERPEDTYHIREHILCGDLPISARKCHLCNWILASCCRSDLEAIIEWAGADEDRAGTENVEFRTISGEDAFSGDFEKERIQLKIGRILHGIIGFDISSYPESKFPLSGTILLSQIVRILR